MLATLQGLGSDVSNCASVTEGLAAAGLDWEVEVRPLYYKTRDGGTRPGLGAYGVIRTDTEQMLGRVGGDYVPISNVTALAGADHLLESGRATLDAVWSLRGGQHVGVSMRLNERVAIDGDDPVEMYVTVTTAHNGSGQRRVELSPIRIWCTNQLALSHASCLRSWSTKHIAAAAQFNPEVDNARIDAYLAWFSTVGAQLARTRFSQEDLELTLKRALTFVNEETARRKLAAEIIERWATSDLIGDDYRATAWGALNAVAEWIDHRRVYRNSETRFRSITSGFGAKLRTRVLRELLL